MGLLTQHGVSPTHTENLYGVVVINHYSLTGKKVLQEFLRCYILTCSSKFFTFHFALRSNATKCQCFIKDENVFIRSFLPLIANLQIYLVEQADQQVGKDETKVQTSSTSSGHRSAESPLN